MIVVQLRERMEALQRRTGEAITYRILAKRTGLSVETLQSIAARANYNTRLSTVEKLCRALGCTPGELLRMMPERVPRRGD